MLQRMLLQRVEANAFQKSTNELTHPCVGSAPKGINGGRLCHLSRIRVHGVQFVRVSNVAWGLMSLEISLLNVAVSVYQTIIGITLHDCVGVVQEDTNGLLL
eukprot:TRINITY_DN56682_c0_g1_i1.p3 TRINITY_DN56682_c0_g1~~TRINITY_DN56682_c0_g1_i1.p3  ORF type:complete len:102 (-),score=7.46 TRINITY_DN56682_c0_g1_i1:477-782(-)